MSLKPYSGYRLFGFQIISDEDSGNLLRAVWNPDETDQARFLLEGFEYTFGGFVKYKDSSAYLRLEFNAPLLEAWPSDNRSFHSYKLWEKLEDDFEEFIHRLAVTQCNICGIEKHHDESGNDGPRLYFYIKIDQRKDHLANFTIRYQTILSLVSFLVGYLSARGAEAV